MSGFYGENRSPLDPLTRKRKGKDMTKIIYKSFLFAFATLATLACQPVDHEPDDTDTTPECGEDETSVVPWCLDANLIIVDIWCNQCGHADSCNPEEWPMFVCDMLESSRGKQPDCVSKEDAAHCLAELTKNACEEEIYHWYEQCDGFSAAH
jgi:hypothetical protein